LPVAEFAALVQSFVLQISNQSQIVEAIVLFVAVDVVDRKAIRNLPVGLLPLVHMSKHMSATFGGRVPNAETMVSLACCVSLAARMD
jgi:hypothetical protein